LLVDLIETQLANKFFWAVIFSNILCSQETWDKDLSNHIISSPASEYLPSDENCLVTGKSC